jgi:hypothetical protein
MSYVLSDDFLKGPQLKEAYRLLSQGDWSIKYGDIELNIYDPKLLAFLITPSVPVNVMDEKWWNQLEESPQVAESATINGRDYIQSYAEGYMSGIQYLTQTYVPTPDALYEPMRIESIKYRYDGNGLNNWSQWYGMMLGSISHEQVRESGYYAGILSELERLCKEHKPLKDVIERRYPFRAEEFRPKSAQQIKEPFPVSNMKLTHPQIAILHHYLKQPINKNNADDIAKRYGQGSGQRLVAVYKELTSPLVRTAKGKNRVSDIKAVLHLLTGTTKELASKELRDAEGNNSK